MLSLADRLRRRSAMPEASRSRKVSSAARRPTVRAVTKATRSWRPVAMAFRAGNSTAAVLPVPVGASSSAWPALAMHL